MTRAHASLLALPLAAGATAAEAPADPAARPAIRLIQSGRGRVGLNFLDQLAYTIDSRRGLLELR